MYLSKENKFQKGSKLVKEAVNTVQSSTFAFQ